jgi:hypothetical protein
LFMAAAREGSLARAAEKEHIATSALSRRIADLEQVLRAPLFIRSPRGVTLTAAGQIVLARGTQLEAELQSLARVVLGQVVASQDVIFQIVDPKGLWVGALLYGEIDPAKVTGASATAVDGTPLKLTFQGFSKALQQQATVVQFAVEIPPGKPVRRLAGRGGRPASPPRRQVPPG